VNDPEDIAVLLTDSGLLNKMVFNFSVFCFFFLRLKLSLCQPQEKVWEKGIK